MKQIKEPSCKLIPGYMSKKATAKATALLWVTEDNKSFFWDITVRIEGELQFLHCEIYTKSNRDITMDKLTSILDYLLENNMEVIEVKKYLNSKFLFEKCDVYKMYGEQGEKATVLEKSKGADEPILKYPGTRRDLE